MRKSAVLITGASGEVGHGLIERLAAEGSPIVTLDVVPLQPGLSRLVQREVVGSILDAALLERLLAEYDVDLIFHLAALLSTRAEFSPVTAHQVNVGGTLQLLEFAQHQAESHGRSVAFLYPSSIAVYGLPDRDTQAQAERLTDEFRDEFGELDEIFAVRRFAFRAFPGSFSVRRIKKKQIDVGRIIQFL